MHVEMEVVEPKDHAYLLDELMCDCCVVAKEFAYITVRRFCYVAGDYQSDEAPILKHIAATCPLDMRIHEESQLRELEQVSEFDKLCTSVAVKGSSDSAEILFQSSALLSSVRIQSLAATLQPALILLLPRLDANRLGDPFLLRSCPRADDLNPPFT